LVLDSLSDTKQVPWGLVIVGIRLGNYAGNCCPRDSTLSGEGLNCLQVINTKTDFFSNDLKAFNYLGQIRYSVVRHSLTSYRGCDLTSDQPAGFAHVLRHTFAVTTVQKVVSLPSLQRLLGHDHLATTEIYLNLSPEELIREFQQKW